MFNLSSAVPVPLVGQSMQPKLESSLWWLLQGAEVVVTEVYHVPLSPLWVCSHGYHSRSNLLALHGQQEHVIMALHVVSGDSTGHKHRCPAAEGPTDPIEALQAGLPAGNSSTLSGHCHTVPNLLQDSV